MKNILLINAEGVQTVCLARSLRKQGHRVIGFCHNKITSGYATRWLTEKYILPDITSKPADFKKQLFTYLSQNRIDLIIPLSDNGAEFLSRNKEEIQNKFSLKCAIPPFEVFNLANDKQKLMQLCEQYDICHPKTSAVNLDNIKEVSDYIGFPALIKPNLSQGARGIMYVNDVLELQKKLPYVQEQFGPCSLQQYVEQPDYYYNVMLYRDKHGRMDYYTITKIRRFFPLKGGSSCYCETIQHDFLLNQCKALLEKLNWYGFADFDVLEDVRTRELKIIEINPRVPSSFQAAFAANVDFGKVFIADEFDEMLPKFHYKTGMQVRWLGLDVMWFVFSNKRFTFKPTWFKFFGKNVSYQDGSWNDPLPMFAGMLAGVVKYMNPNFRKSKLNK